MGTTNPLFPLHPVDDVSLAFSIGIRTKTLWWLILSTDIDLIEKKKGSYNRFPIPKGDGSYRVIHEPRPALKNIQKALLVTYFNPLPVGNHVGAYVVGRSVQDTARAHVGNAVKLSMDIRNFFGSTRRVWVREWLRTLHFNEDVVRLLTDLMTVPVRRGDGVISVLPQGAPTSGVVANHVAQIRIDDPVIAVLRDQFGPDGWVYTRYSDNLEISFEENRSFEEMNEIRDLLWTVINDYGYRLRPEKVYFQRRDSPERPYRVLGFAANEKLNIPNEKYRRLRAIVHNVHHTGFEPQYQRFGAESPEQMYTSLRGKLIYWNQVAPWKIQPLLHQLDETYQLRNLSQTTSSGSVGTADPGQSKETGSSSPPSDESP